MIRVVSGSELHTHVTSAPPSEGPASAPTYLVEITATNESARMTALPAPPRIPSMSAFEPRLPEAAIPLGIPQRTRPVLAIIATLQDPSARPTKRMATGTKLRLVTGMQPSHPPSLPPGSAPVKRAA